MNLNDNFLMKRCLNLASKGIGRTSPNPMVGAVIVSNNKIIGEGYHKGYGEDHAEVCAIKSVKNKKLLEGSTLYVNLEPCNHFGKTPPCTDLIIRKKISKVVIGTSDPNPKVSGKGIKKLIENKIDVKVNILKEECCELNKRFFCYQRNKRPYIILKWAESKDRFIAPSNKKNGKIYWISSPKSRKLVHKWRSEEDSIAVGINTIISDNPQLDNRYFGGKSAIPIIIDPDNRLKNNFKVFQKHKKIFHFIDTKINDFNKSSIKINFEKSIESMINYIYKKNINSILVEGGAKTINSFIDLNLWDEARVFRSKKNLITGIKAPVFSYSNEIIKKNISEDELSYYLNSLENKL